MRFIQLIYLVIVSAFLSSCNFSCSIGDSKSVKTKDINSGNGSPVVGATIKNDIDVEATAVKVGEVYLIDEKGNLLTENVTGIGEKIRIVIKADTGWSKHNGRSYVGASERVLTAAGKVVLDAADVFRDYEAEGFTAADAGFITLSAVITEARQGIEDFVVQFRVWDRKGDGEIRGRYKFRIRK